MPETSEGHSGCACGVNRRGFSPIRLWALRGLGPGAMLQRTALHAPPRLASGSAGRQAALRAQSQERDLAVHVGGRQPDRKLRSEAGPEQVRRTRPSRRRPTRTVVRIPLTIKKNSRIHRRPAQDSSEESIRCRIGFRSAVRAASRSATGGRMSERASTILPWSARCGPPTTITRAQLQFHTGRHIFEGNNFPSIGSWVHYGLGSSTRICPSSSCWAIPSPAAWTWAQHRQLSGTGAQRQCIYRSDPQNPLPFAIPGAGDVQRGTAEGIRLSAELNQLSAVKYPDDRGRCGRIKSYELAFRMQTAVPDVMRFQRRESTPRKKLYGLDQESPSPSARTCLTARRLVERGVRFVGVFHGGRRRRRLVGCAQRAQEELRRALREGGSADRALLKDLKTARAPGRNAGGLGHRVRPDIRRPGSATAATIIPTASPSGWRAAASRAASRTARPTSWDSMPSKTGTTSPTSMPRFSTSWVWIRTASKCPATSGWRSTSAIRSKRLWPDIKALLPLSYRQNQHACQKQARRNAHDRERKRLPARQHHSNKRRSEESAEVAD